ncbi:FMN-linked oxidoreductase [Trichocladium antarcticum]|uniref:FMN-linked oxidoreductase n=1 Tax=Trichocladium antarcticum TaxID=1450529 RepID=A0AAN6UFV8_9PEZI|nr:FMN-linked oxidoreductase [Trichocladium antarcticum]
MTIKKVTASTPAPGVPYYTPAQDPPVGTALDPRADVPTLFTPLTLRGMTLQNRFAVSPMCMYSADDGHLTDFHVVHLGAFALRGAALTIVEATAVTPNGRISPEDSGLWTDSQIAPLKRVVDFVHSQGHKIGVQLAHAGRKASTLSLWHLQTLGPVATPAHGGWPDDLWAPSAIAWDADHPTPNEMTVAQIDELVQRFADAAHRAVQAGVDTIEIHGAHGYLITQFLSPITNHRTDAYGGTFANRTRLLLAIIRAIRAVIPARMPLLLRLSATEWMEHTHTDPQSLSSSSSWDLPQTIQLAALLPDLGVDLLDVSSGGNNPRQQIAVHPYYQVDLAAAIRAAVRAPGGKGGPLAIGAVGMIRDAAMARDVVAQTASVEGEHGLTAKADLVLVGRQFLREPEFVLRAAAELGVAVKLPLQYERAPLRKAQRL